MRDEQTVRAYLKVVRNVVLLTRLRSRGDNRLSDENLFDLMDAIHNIPTFLAERDHHWFTPERMRERFIEYDARWSGSGGLNLVKVLDEALETKPKTNSPSAH